MTNLTFWVIGLTMWFGQPNDGDAYAKARAAMVAEFVRAAGVTDERVLSAMEKTPRHEFVPAEQRRRAYFDMALPIGHRQTISSPFIVAYMTACLEPQPSDSVLEIGTGSGYQAAVLSPLVAQVYTIEIVAELGKTADATLQRLGYKNVQVRVGDGFKGWPEHAPFDKIIVTCSPEDVPQPLVTQLREGGLMVIPIGEQYHQTLCLMRKQNGKLVTEALRPTLFVPMTGAAESNRNVHLDPARPTLVNGDFEEKANEDGFIPGWYYQRHARQMSHTGVAEGARFVRFENDEPGRSSHLLQGFPIDGRRVQRLRISASLQTRHVRHGEGANQFPVLAVSFYDSERREVSLQYMGPYEGSHAWKRYSDEFHVPVTAREALFRVGLFGSTGIMDVDDVRIEAAQ